MYQVRIFSRMSLRSKVSGMIVLIILMVATSFILIVIKEVDVRLRFNLMVATFILSIWGVAIGIVLASRVTWPLRRLMENVKAISNGRLHERVEIPSGGEIGELAEAFDQMAIELEKRIMEITAAKDSLEKLLDKERKMRQEMARSRRLSDVGEFAAAMAHEIRNPLARVMMGAYSLKEDTLNRVDRDESIENILNGVEDLNRLVTELLNYTGKVELHKSMIDLKKLLEYTLFKFREDIEKMGIKIVEEIAPDIPEIEIDGIKIEQVFNNIIKNALQAMPDGGQLKIEVRSSPLPPSTSLRTCLSLSPPTHCGRRPMQWVVRPQWVPRRGEVSREDVEIIFSDTGCGIPEEHMDKIFNPFFTTKPDGTGLGLALVHRIIEAHGGKVGVESGKGCGSIFRLVLPVENAPRVQSQ